MDTNHDTDKPSGRRRRLAAGAASLAFAGVGLMAAAGAAHADNFYQGTPMPSHNNTQLCMDASGGAYAGAQIIQYWCNGGGNQYWYESTDKYGRPTLRSGGADGLCVDINQQNTSPGGSLILWYCNDGWNQVWDDNHGNNSYVNPNTGFAIDDPGWSTTPGALETWYYNGGANQQWGYYPGTQLT